MENTSLHRTQGRGEARGFGLAVSTYRASEAGVLLPAALRRPLILDVEYAGTLDTSDQTPSRYFPATEETYFATASISSTLS